MADKRRICAPIDTVPPVGNPRQPCTAASGRLGGRDAMAVRPIFLETDVNPQATGSSLLEMNGTKVICSVYGPRQSHRRQPFRDTGVIDVEVLTSPFAGTHRLAPGKNAQDGELAALVEQALLPSLRLDTFPKLSVDIYIVILENGGSVLPAAINCATAALASAGIPMNDLAIACNTVSIAASAPASGADQSQQSLWIDPCLEEEASPDLAGSMLVTYMPTLNETSLMISTGSAPPTQVTEAFHTCLAGCLSLHKTIVECLTRDA
ncbi:hypothetical protein H696_01812 [Fonticula alba]|uniref:Exoribonuclease phosphorolytic domain-containing protein n=1 Tax=Fonticula alba TaxID=691883 RepID=A0A058ZDC9_FONAL|nr:hypothetical protein H696_01812 [Fonticula alba]KCV72415.1 hypothetical protein H696_01812 [Fonticula alba]|eukprot:XP_009493993.1 hypothetical protein H696_01812 [Fonticula alba]